MLAQAADSFTLPVLLVCFPDPVDSVRIPA